MAKKKTKTKDLGKKIFAWFMLFAMVASVFTIILAGIFSS